MAAQVGSYEYLWLLADRTREAAAELGASLDLFCPDGRTDELTRKLVRTMIDYARDPAELRAVREEIASEIMQLDAAPKAVVTTDPPTHHTLAAGPIVVATRIWAEDGCEIQVNGQPAHSQPDGSWAHHTFVNTETGEVKVEITKGDAKKTIVRTYSVETGG